MAQAQTQPGHSFRVSASGTEKALPGWALLSGAVSGGGRGSPGLGLCSASFPSLKDSCLLESQGLQGGRLQEGGLWEAVVGAPACWRHRGGALHSCLPFLFPGASSPPALRPLPPTTHLCCSGRGELL